MNQIDLDNIDGNTARKLNKEQSEVVEELELVSGTLDSLINQIKDIEKKTYEKARADFREMTADYLEVKQKLMEFPERIQEQKEHIAGLEDAVEELAQEVQVREDTKMLEIQEATDEKGKKKYSNKGAREAALNMWKDADEEYKAVKYDLKSAKRDVESAKFELDRIYNDYKSCQKVADMMTARMNMFVN